jgi:chemotaxis protein CheX
MDVQYINPFVLAVKRVFETTLRTQVQIGKAFVKHDPSASADVSGVIGLSGDVVGCVVLSFPSAVAARAASEFAGTGIDENHPDFADAIGELANMVAGSAKKEFHEANISLSLPSVITGKEHMVSTSRLTPRIVIPCETQFGPVYVEVGMTVENTVRQQAVTPEGA